MNELALAATVVLGCAVLVLFAVSIVRRLVTEVSQRRTAPRRQEFEQLLGEFLADDDAAPLVRPARRSDRTMMRRVLSEVALELRGADLDRVATAFEELGIVDDAIDDLLAFGKLRRRRGADTLASARAQCSVDVLTHGLDDRDLLVRLTCARALAVFGPVELAPRLLQIVVDTVEAQELGSSIAALLAVGERAPSTLANAVPSGSVLMDELVIVAVGELRLHELLPLVHDALQHPEPRVVAAAARSLGQIGDADSVEDLMRELTRGRSHPAVVLATLEALGELGDERTASVLADVAATGDFATRIAAIDSLRKLGASGAMSIDAIKAIDDPQLRMLITAGGTG